MGHLHCSSSSSIVTKVLGSEPPDKQPLLDLPRLLAADATFAFVMTAAATLALCSGCLLCLPPWFLPLAMTTPGGEIFICTVNKRLNTVAPSAAFDLDLVHEE